MRFLRAATSSHVSRRRPGDLGTDELPSFGSLCGPSDFQTYLLLNEARVKLLDASLFGISGLLSPLSWRTASVHCMRGSKY